MFDVVVSNNIDYSARFSTDNPMIAFLWAVAQLRGPCRSGGADFYNKSLYLQ